VIIQIDLAQLFYPGFTLAAGPPSGFTTDGIGCWGEVFTNGWRIKFLFKLKFEESRAL
jgi:hypothetical protein